MSDSEWEERISLNLLVGLFSHGCAAGPSSPRGGEVKILTLYRHPGQAASLRRAGPQKSALRGLVVSYLNTWRRVSLRSTRPTAMRSIACLKKLKRKYGETEPLHMDHQPSFAAQRLNAENRAGRALTPDELRELRNNSPAVASPRDIHLASDTFGGRNTPSKIAQDAADLQAAGQRNYADFLEAMNKRRNK